jgi:hypothetical protein
MTDASSDSPIFIVGTPRSGTTLTAKILGRHSNIFMPGETHFFEDIYARRGEIGDLVGAKEKRVVAERLYSLYHRHMEKESQFRVESMFADSTELYHLIESCHDYGEVLSTFMSAQMSYEKKFRWGNNVPRDIFHIEDIWALYPGAKVIICVRDIRAFLLSYRNKWKVARNDFQIERMKDIYHPVVTSLLWKSSMKTAMAVLGEPKSDDVKLVRYEDLVGEPNQTLASICQFIGEEFEPDIINVRGHNSSHTSQSQQGIFSTSINLWETELTAEEISVGQVVAQKEMLLLGYEKKPVSGSLLRMAYMFLQTPVALFRALRANRDIIGPLVPYMARRIKSLLVSN